MSVSHCLQSLSHWSLLSSFFQVADFDLETGGGSSVAGLVLEAPFNCMRDEVMTFRAAQALTWIMDIEQTLETAGVMFETNKWLPAVKVMIIT